ncbi:hypothetical protein [Desulfonatronum parangueonense]
MNNQKHSRASPSSPVLRESNPPINPGSSLDSSLVSNSPDMNLDCVREISPVNDQARCLGNHAKPRASLSTRASLGLA